MAVIYRVTVASSAEREVQRLPKSTRVRLLEWLTKLETQPRPPICVKLKASDFYRIRIGDYRVIYAIDDGARLVEILMVGHRRDVYRDL